MTYRSPTERRHMLARRLKWGAFLFALGVLALWLDRPVHALLLGDEAALERNDWYQMFRAFGFLPTWLLIAGAIALVEHRSQPVRRTGLTIMLSATASGLIAEILKPILGRHRPDLEGHLVWNPILGAIFDPDKYGSSLGLPSSHAAVAFGGAMAVAMLYRGAAPVALVAAAGCAVTRLLAGAHAVSDIYLAILIAWAAAKLSLRLMGDRETRPQSRFG